jgi:hypothetical protein
MIVFLAFITLYLTNTVFMTTIFNIEKIPTHGLKYRLWLGVMVFNATFNNILAKSKYMEKNHRPAASHWQTYQIMLYRVHLTWAGFELTTIVVICTDCTDSNVVNPTTIRSRPWRPLVLCCVIPTKYKYGKWNKKNIFIILVKLVQGRQERLLQVDSQRTKTLLYYQ